MSLEAKIFQESIWKQIVAVANGGQLAGPLVVELDPTTYCDSACPECISGRLLNQGRFSTDRLRRLCEELVASGVRAVILIGGGEPLLHPGTNEVIRILGQAGVSVGVTTNGTQIHRCLEVLAEHATWTRVSVDAGSPEVYQAFRPHRSGDNLFAQVIDNMENLAKRKQGALGYSFLLMYRPPGSAAPMETNAFDVYRAGSLAKQIGCDYFEVKPAYDLGHFLLPKPADLIAEIEDQLARLATLNDDGFRVLCPRTLSTVLNRQETVEPKEYDRCLVSEVRTLITPHGAFVCPYFRGAAAQRYGDPTTQPFQELWRSAERERVMQRTRPSETCRFHCIRHGANQTLYAIGREAVSPELREDYDLFL